MAAAAERLLGRDEVAVDPAGPIGAAVRLHRVVVASSPYGHEEVPRRHLAEILQSLGL
jgi:hypothetical protein